MAGQLHGPWEKVEATTTIPIRNAQGRTVASVRYGEDDDRIATAISAVPDLVLALEFAMPALEAIRKQFPRSKHDDSIDVLAFARAALTKAGIAA